MNYLRLIGTFITASIQEEAAYRAAAAKIGWAEAGKTVRF